MIIGIDLGTTHSVAAYLTPDGPQLIPNALGEVLTPSVIGIDESDRLLVGRAASEYQVLHPERCVSLFKRYMGSDWSTTIAGKKFSPELLSSLVLRSIKEDAEKHLGYDVEEAVITVPAYFNEPQRKATLNAGRIAGLRVRRIVNEPTAAALAYGFHSLDEEKVLVVVDLGGGTFDVAIVDVFEGALEVRASSGESFLGGEDFTRALAAKVLDKAGVIFERAELDAPLMVSRVIHQCEVAKRQLTTASSATARVPDRNGDYQPNSPVITITKAEFEQWMTYILTRIELPIRRALGDANLKRDDVDEVILVGGATRMPMVIDRVRQLFGKTPHSRLNPDEVVALGAAIQGGLIGQDESVEDLVVTDVSPFTLGVEISKHLGLEVRNGYFLPIIHRNTTIPVSRVERVQTVSANQNVVEVKVYQGESRRIDNNLLLGEFVVKDLPKGPAGQEVDIRFTYDLNGVLEVEATIVATNRVVNHVITRHARRLSEQEIAQALRAMQHLKVHPREEEANRLTLRRAERIYKELPPLERHRLSDMMDGFEATLSLGEAGPIEEYRQHMEAYLDRFERGFDMFEDERSPDEF